MRRFAMTMAAAILLAAGPSFAQTADPQIGQANDQEIAQAIVKNLKAHQDAGRLKGFDIDLNVEAGKVTLTGNVTSADQHKLAIDAARFVPGVKVVVNDLKIAGAVAEHPEQQKTLGAGLASFFSRNSETEATPPLRPTPSTPASAPAMPRSARQAHSTPENGSSQGLLAGLRNAWGQSDAEIQQQTPQTQFTQAAAAPAQPATLLQQQAVPMLQPEAPTAELAQQQTIASPLKIAAQTAQPKIERSQVQWQQPQSSYDERASEKSLVGDFDPIPTQSPLGSTAQPVATAQAELAALSIQPSRPTFEPNEILANSDEVRPITQEITRPQPIAQQVAAVAPQAAPQQQPAPQPQRQVRQVRFIPVPVAAYPPRSQSPMAYAPSSLPGSPQQAPMQQGQYGQYAQYGPMMAGPNGAPIQMVQAMQPQQVQPAPQFIQGTGGGVIPARYDHPQMPGYAWPSYASYPNYAALQYPQQYSAHAWPYIGPFYPYPQVPLGWRKVTLTWDDGWWQLDFKDKGYGPYVTR